MKPMKLSTLLFSCALLFAASPAFAEDSPDVPTAPPATPRFDFVRVSAGLKTGYVDNRAFDTYGSNNALPQFSIDGTYPLLSRGKLALAAGLGWDVGGSDSSVRGTRASLSMHRLYVPIEARLHVAKWMYGFLKVAPGAAAMIGTLSDASAPDGETTTTGWAFAGDASAGASFLLGPHKDFDKRTVRFWVTPEMGYGFTTAASVRPHPSRPAEDALGTDESTNQRALALSGFFWRASLALTF